MTVQETESEREGENDVCVCPKILHSSRFAFLIWELNTHKYQTHPPLAFSSSHILISYILAL